MYSVGCRKEETPEDKTQGAMQARCSAWANQHFLPAYSQYKYHLPGSFCLCFFCVFFVCVLVCFFFPHNKGSDGMVYEEQAYLRVGKELGRLCFDLGGREIVD